MHAFSWNLTALEDTPTEPFKLVYSKTVKLILTLGITVLEKNMTLVVQPKIIIKD